MFVTRDIMVAGKDKFQDIWQCLLATPIRPMVMAEWWQKELDVLEQIVKGVKCYAMKFDQSGAMVRELVKLGKG
jgi:hypothetical protein